MEDLQTTLNEKRILFKRLMGLKCPKSWPLALALHNDITALSEEIEECKG